jgi:hypothetical protein
MRVPGFLNDQLSRSPEFTAPGLLFFHASLNHLHLISEKTHLKEQLLKIGGVSRVTGVREVTLIRWFDRMTIKPCDDATTTGSGDHRRFSRATINQIAIAKKQIDLGVPPGPANAAATLFTEHGQPGRPANKLF